MPIVINMVCHGIHEPTNVNDYQLFKLNILILLIIQSFFINCKWIKFPKMTWKPSKLIIYHISQYSMKSSLIRSMHVRRTKTWCLHKFSCNVHSHVQHAYMVNRFWTLQMTLACHYFCINQAMSFLSFWKVGWKTWMCKINVTFFMFAMTMCFTTLFLIQSHFCSRI